MCGVASIDSERVADHEACAGTAEPKDGRGDFFWSAEPADRLIPHDFLHGIGLLCQHVRDHRRVDCSRAHRVDADAPLRIFKRGAPGQSDHAVLGGVVGRPAG